MCVIPTDSLKDAANSRHQRRRDIHVAVIAVVIIYGCGYELTRLRCQRTRIRSHEFVSGGSVHAS